MNYLVQYFKIVYFTAELSVHPDFAGMFGGKILDVSGPHFSNSQDIYCKFQDVRIAVTFILIIKKYKCDTSGNILCTKTPSSLRTPRF